MSRPAGTPFWGESRPPFDWAVLAGSAAYAHADGPVDAPSDAAPGGARLWGEGDGLGGDDFVRVASSAKMLWLFSSLATYLDAGDVAVASWVVRARGTGSLSVTNDLDTDYNYTDPAGPVIGTATVSSTGWTEFDFPTTAYTVPELADAAGGFRLAVECAGSVDIDVVQLRVWPPGGALGEWASPSGSEVRPVITNGRSDRFDAGDNNYTDWHSAYVASTALLPTTPVRGVAGTLTPGLDVRAGSQWVGNLSGTIHIFVWSFSAGFISFDVGADEQAPAWATGTEGVDYIRRPDRTYMDARRYWEWAAPGAAPSVVGWENAVIFYSQGRTAPPSYGYGIPPVVSFGFVDYLTPVPGEETYEPSPIEWPTGVGGYALPITDGNNTGSIPVSPPMQDRFSLVFDHNWMSAEPAEPDLTGQAGNGTALAGNATLTIGAAEAPLTALVSIPPFKRWMPATPVSWVRQKQRGDGYGTAPRRARAYTSIRQRGIQ